MSGSVCVSCVLWLLIFFLFDLFVFYLFVLFFSFLGAYLYPNKKAKGRVCIWVGGEDLGWAGEGKTMIKIKKNLFQFLKDNKM